MRLEVRLKQSLWAVVCLPLLLIWSGVADAYTTNSDLKTQVAQEEGRVLPCKDFYCFAIDGHAFYRDLNGQGGYYHGGYWLDNFIELTPGSHLIVNAKVAAYNPAASYGLVSTSYVVPFVGLTWKDNLANYSLFDTDIRLTWFDLDRQTLGAGLTLEEKEMSGVNLSIQKSAFRFKLVADGTGGYDVPGDLLYYQVDYGQDLIGFYRFTHYINGIPFLGIYSKHPIGEHLNYRAELSSRNRTAAGLLGIEAKGEFLRGLGVRVGYQTRYYGGGYAEEIKRHIEHDYLSIEQEDQPFTKSMDIFVVDDNVLVNAGNIDIHFDLSRQIRLFSENELASFAYRVEGTQFFHFYRHGVRICPEVTPNACGFIFVSNKIVAARAPTYVNDTANKFQFEDARFIGIDARFSF